MKTTEEKAKAYDNVVGKLKQFMAQGVDPLITRADAQDFFPELKESENEKMLRALREGFDILDKDDEWYSGITNGQILVWLEKQGEKGTNGNDREIPLSAWNEEDEMMLECVLDKIGDLGTGEMCKFWLKSLKDRYSWKPNERQIKALEDSIEFLGCTKKVREDLKSLYEQLKKLKEGKI